MKYRNENYDRKVNLGQVFDPVIDEWKFSEVDGCPVVVGKINQQEMIQQYADCALSAILDRFLPEEKEKIYKAPVVHTDEIVDQRAAVFRNDLDVLTDILNEAEDMRERYGLSETATVAEIFAEVQKRSTVGLERLKQIYPTKGDVVNGDISTTDGTAGQNNSASDHVTGVSANNQEPISENNKGEQRR